MADRACRTRRLTAAGVLAASLAAVAAAASAPDPVTLTVSPSARVDPGTSVRLTARARLAGGARIRITGRGVRVADCLRSPCVVTYRGRASGAVPFRASVVSDGKVRAVSRTLTVRWAAAAPVTSRAGDYAGRTTQNETIGFTVTEDGTVTRLVIGRLIEACIYPEGNRVSRIGGGIGPLARAFPIAPDGSFQIELGGPTIVSNVASAYHVTISGRLRSGTAVGTIRDDVTAPAEPKLSCTTGDQSWVVVKS